MNRKRGGRKDYLKGYGCEMMQRHNVFQMTSRLRSPRRETTFCKRYENPRDNYERKRRKIQREYLK